MTGPSVARRALELFAAAVLYFAAARLGLALATPVPQVSLIWPPTGIALTLLLLRGPHLWPALFAGALAANAMADEPIGTALVIACGNTSAGLLAWDLLRRLDFRPELHRLRDVLLLQVFGAAAPSVVSASVGTLALCLGGLQSWSAAPRLWSVWWLGDAMGVVLLTPFLLLWTTERPVFPPLRSLLEGVVVLAGLAVVARQVFASGIEGIVPQPGLGYLVFPFAMWAALRLGLRGAATAVLLTASIAIGMTAGGEPRDLALLQLFLAAFALSTLLLAASGTERRQAQARIAALHATARALADADAVPTAPGIFAAMSSSLVWECGSLWTVDPEHDALVCLDVWRRAGGEDAFTMATRAIRFPRGVGLPGRVWADGAGSWVRDVTQDLNFPRASAAAATGLRTGFAVPLTLDGRVVGVLEFFTTARARPDAVLLDTMTFVGTQVGRVLERRQAREAVRRSERDLHAANLELRRSNAELERFASIASHDLQEPLRTITTFAQLFERRHGAGLDAEAREVLGFVVDGAARMSALISGLLEYSRVGQGVRREPLLAGEAAREALANLAGAVAEKAARVRIATLPQVLADRRELVQVFQNLLGNAIKFSEGRAPEIEITGWPEGDAVHFRVSDNGIGIPPGLLDRAFVLFQRLHVGQGYPGTGLGLAICKKIVEGHGGRIWAESVVGEGSSVHFTLPPGDGTRLSAAPSLQASSGS